ncbi:MAG: alpha/beta fold hydrolase [Pseudomonadota bacterium]
MWRRLRSWQGIHLERARDASARVVLADGHIGFKGSYGAALAYFHQQTNARHAQAERAVVMVHGLLGDSGNFELLSRALQGQGHAVQHFRYASCKGYRMSADGQLAQLIKRLPPRSAIVAHSLGCRLAAHALQSASMQPLKLVFIAPPASRVQWARRGNKLGPVRSFLGTSLTDLADHPMPMTGLRTHDLLVIEGRSDGQRSDGWLTSQETQMAVPHKREIVQASHSDLTHAPATRAAVLKHLEGGDLSHDQARRR